MPLSYHFKMELADPIRIGVSSCLLGHKVRYDGGHKRDPLLTDLLRTFVTFVPVCPELEIGLGVPRESIHLALTDRGKRLVAPRSGRDLTDDMRAYADRRLAELESEGLSGYILKKDSPTCGMERVRLHRPGQPPLKEGAGLFAEQLLARWPWLPVEEEGRLNDPPLRENFFLRVFAFHRLTQLFRSRWSAGDMVRFHTGEKLLLMAHDADGYRALGRCVADIKRLSRDQAASRYRTLFMRTLSRPATTRRHVNVLQHAAGHLRDTATEAERRELHSVIDDYRRGLVPLIAPIILLRSLVRIHRIDYLENQTYLYPHPKELLLRNHV